MTVAPTISEASKPATSPWLRNGGTRLNPLSDISRLGRIVAASNQWVDGTTLQVPTFGYHTMEETVSLDSVDAFIKLLFALSKIPD
jgi:hypothetical protein